MSNLNKLKKSNSLLEIKLIWAILHLAEIIFYQNFSQSKLFIQYITVQTNIRRTVCDCDSIRQNCAFKIVYYSIYNYFDQDKFRLYSDRSGHQFETGRDENRAQIEEKLTAAGPRSVVNYGTDFGLRSTVDQRYITTFLKLTKALKDQLIPSIVIKIQNFC